MTLRHQRAEFSEQPPKAAPDNACRSRRGSGGARRSRVRVCSGAQPRGARKGSRLASDKSADTGTGECPDLDLRACGDEMARGRVRAPRGRKERSRFARLFFCWGTSSCGPAAGSPNPSLATPQLAMRRALVDGRAVQELGMLGVLWVG